MTSLTKKIVAIVTTVTCAAWMISPGIASALTAEELQAQIATLTAQLATLQTELTSLTGTTAGYSSNRLHWYNLYCQFGTGFHWC